MALNKQQKTAVEKTEGPCVILAGAGTGKSFTVIEKVSHLVKEGYVPEEILCLTFSNEATNSLNKKLQERGVNAAVKTFHAYCADVLRQHGHLIKVDESFEIILPDDAKVLLHKYLDIAPYWADRYVSTIQSAKDFGITLQDIKTHAGRIKKQLDELLPEGVDPEKHEQEMRIKLNTLHLRPSGTVEERRAIREEKKEIQSFLAVYDEYEKFKEFIEAWEGYDKLKQEKNYLDFSDLNVLVLQLFEQFGVQSGFSYVFVDEFQDTNKLQFSLIEYIASHGNITVVGDPNQSIYGFRGAYRESFEHFKQVFNVQDIIKLEASYRSPDNVLGISYELIKNSYEDPSECIKVENADGVAGDPVDVVELLNKEEEARYIADTVEQAISDGVPKDEICVLHRTHQQAEVIKQALERKGIPVISAGRTNLLQKREVRTAISYLAMLSNVIERSGSGEQSWWDLFHYQNTLSPKDSIKIGRYLKKHDVSIDELMLNHLDEVNLSEAGLRVVSRVKEKLQVLLEGSNKPLPELVLDVLEISGLNRAFTYSRTVENIEALMNLKKLYELAEDFYNLHEQNLSDFIDYIEIVDSLGVNVDASKQMNVDAVRLMTIHAVKGLEYDLVIVSNMAEKRFPVTRTQNEPLIPKELLPDLSAEIRSWGDIPEKEKERRIKDYERRLLIFEERRLCYVAWTRAKKKLILTYARSYNNQPDSNAASVFLQEINYQDNPMVEFVSDPEELSSIVAPDSRAEQYKARLKEQVVTGLDADDFPAVVEKVMNYFACRGQTDFDLSQVTVDRGELERHRVRCEENKSLLMFDASNFTFSPSALMMYDECPKKFELSYLYQMPQRGEFEVDAASTGSFVHKVLEEGVKAKADYEGYLRIASEMLEDPEWEGIDLEEVKPLISVFWERNKDKIGDSQTEMKLPVEIEGFRFFGVADRVDKLPDGTVEIIDYKTNKGAISPKKRAWQLGFYALALQQMGYTVSKLTLDMLKLDKPFSVELVDGEATPERGKGFNLAEVREELVSTAKRIAHDYEHEFNTTEDDNCRFCGYKFYCPRWDE